jgi:hypothetical protein
MYDVSFVEYESMHLFLIYSAEALAFLLVVGYSLGSLNRGAWAAIGATGGAIGALTAGVLAVGWGQVEFAETSGLFEFLARHSWIGEAMDWSRPGSVLLIGLALWLASRAKPTPRS